MTKKQMLKGPRPLVGRLEPDKLARELRAGVEFERTNIRRFTDPDFYEQLGEINDALAEPFGRRYKPGTQERSGVSIIPRTEIHGLRRRPTSKLGRLSLPVSLDVIENMLPESRRKPLSVTLGRFILSKPDPVNYQSAVLIDLVSANILKRERRGLTRAIDEFEGHQHDWPEYKPHITLGNVAAKTTYIRTVMEIGSQFEGLSVPLLPVNTPPVQQTREV